MRKWFTAVSLGVFAFTAVVLSGCMIDPPTEPNRIANILTLDADALEKLPSGYVYEGWLVTGSLNDESEFVPDDPSTWERFGRFNWDKYTSSPLLAGTDTPMENRFDAQVNILEFDRIFITITIEDEDSTEVSSGIVILQGEIDEVNDNCDLQHPISTADISDFNQWTQEITFWVYSQSDGDWWDDENAGYGIWFGEPESLDVVRSDTLDSVRLCFVEEDWDTCEEGISWEDADSIHYDIFTWVDSAADTVVNPSLETLPNAVDGWSYEAWITFTEDSPLQDPLSLGRFKTAESADDDSSYCIKSQYDRNFTVPGEDFFQNVPVFGELDVVNNEYVDNLYVTVEPDPDFDEDSPFWQLIIFSAPVPDPRDFYPATGTGSLSDTPAQYQFLMVVRDIGYELNMGYRWPTMHIDFEREMLAGE